VYRNADGSYTRRTCGEAVNYRASDGTWRPVDTALDRTADGRLHNRADSVGVDFAPNAADPALATVRTSHGPQRLE